MTGIVVDLRVASQIYYTTCVLAIHGLKQFNLKVKIIFFRQNHVYTTYFERRTIFKRAAIAAKQAAKKKLFYKNVSFRTL